MEYVLPKQIMSDTGSNSVSEKFREFYTYLNTEQTVSSSYHHQSNGQVEACINIIKHTIKKCFDANADVNLASLQIRSTPLGPGLPHHLMLLIKHSIRGILPVLCRSTINDDNNDDHYEDLVDKPKMIPFRYSQKPVSIPIRSMDPWNHIRQR